MSNADERVQARIAEARRRRERRRALRAEMNEARQYGLVARMRSKTRRWDDDEEAA